MAFNSTDASAASGGHAYPQGSTPVGGMTKVEYITTETVKGYVSRGELPATAADRTRIVQRALSLAIEIGSQVTAYEIA